MKSIFRRINRLSRRGRTSLIAVNAIIGIISTIMSIVGVTIKEVTNNYLISVLIVVGILIVFYFAVYAVIGLVYKNSVDIVIKNTNVEIKCGDIFKTEGYKLIGCDNSYLTQIDDKVIAKKSLHGQLVLEHANVNEIQNVIAEESKRLGLQPDDFGRYKFPLGSIVKYESSVDGNTYLMLAMSELNENLEVRTNIATFESMLIQMWKEISRVYALNDIVLPVLGTGIMRFEDGPKNNEDLLRCMLCTLNSCGVSFKSKLKIVIYGNAKNIPLYEYKDLFKNPLL